MHHHINNNLNNAESALSNLKASSDAQDTIKIGREYLTKLRKASNEAAFQTRRGWFSNAWINDQKHKKRGLASVSLESHFKKSWEIRAIFETKDPARIKKYLEIEQYSQNITSSLENARKTLKNSGLQDQSSCEEFLTVIDTKAKEDLAQAYSKVYDLHNYQHLNSNDQTNPLGRLKQYYSEITDMQTALEAKESTRVKNYLKIWEVGQAISRDLESCRSANSDQKDYNDFFTKLKKNIINAAYNAHNSIHVNHYNYEDIVHNSSADQTHPFVKLEQLHSEIKYLHRIRYYPVNLRDYMAYKLPMLEIQDNLEKAKLANNNVSSAEMKNIEKTVLTIAAKARQNIFNQPNASIRLFTEEDLVSQLNKQLEKSKNLLQLFT